MFIKMIQVHRPDFQSGHEARDNLGLMSGVNINGFTFVFSY